MNPSLLETMAAYSKAGCSESDLENYMRTKIEQKNLLLETLISNLLNHPEAVDNFNKLKESYQSMTGTTQIPESFIHEQFKNASMTLVSECVSKLGVTPSEIINNILNRI